MAINQSNLPTTYTFKFEDYPDAPEFFAKFLVALNSFSTPTYQVLNGQVGYQNLAAPKIFAKTFTTPASGNPTFNFVNPLLFLPSAVLIGNIYEQGKPTVHPTDATIAYWHSSQGSIYIDNIPNLTAATSYTVTLVVL